MAGGMSGMNFIDHPNSLMTKSAQGEDTDSIRKSAMHSMIEGQKAGWQDGGEYATEHCDVQLPTRQTVFNSSGESVPVICGSTHAACAMTGMSTFWAAHCGSEDNLAKGFGSYYVNKTYQLLKILDADTVYVNWILQLAPDLQFNFTYVAARWWQDDKENGAGFILMLTAAPDSTEVYKNPDLPMVEMHAGTIFVPTDGAAATGKGGYKIPDAPSASHRHTCYFHGKTPIPPAAVATMLDYVHRAMEAIEVGKPYPEKAAEVKI